MSNIKDKELLAFSNATNLDWQFVDLDTSKAGRTSRDVTLNTLLTPASFVREYKDKNGNNKKKYIYGSVGDSYNSAQGFQQMRQSAGILMNYLEECDKNSKEGNFLKEWEVIYGGDSYKVVVDYLENLKKQIKKSYPRIDEEKLINYPTREEIEKQRNLAQVVRVVSRIADETITLVFGYGTGQKPLSFKEASGKIVPGLKESILGDFAKATGSTSVIVTNEIRKNWKSGKEFLTTSSAINKSQGKNIANFIENSGGSINLEKISKNFENVEINATESLKYYNEDFRVAVFKKGSEIVIASRAKKDNSPKNYSQELAYINIVYSLIKQSNPTANYYFTGVDGGGDISFLTSYMDKIIKSNSFYCKPSNPFENFVKLKESSLDSSYSSETSFSLSLFDSGTVDKISTRNLQIIGYNFLLVGLKNQFTLTLLKTNIYTILVYVTVTVLMELFNFICRTYYSNLIKNQYNYLRDIKCIDSNGYVISDYADRKISISLDSNGETVLFDLIAGLFYKLINQGKYGKPSKKIYLSDEIKTNSNEIYILQNIDAYNEWSYKSTYIVLNRENNIYSLKNVLIIEWEITRDIDTKQLRNNIKQGNLKDLLNGIISSKVKIKSQQRIGLLEKDYIGNELLKVLSIINCLETHKVIQDIFKSNSNNLHLTYINGNNVEKKKAIEAKMSKYNGTSSFEINEYCFLPFVQKNGNIDSNIREEYIRNSLRDMVSYFSGDSRFNMDLVNDGIFKCLKFFSTEIQKTPNSEATINSMVKNKTVENKGEFLFSNHLYQKFEKKPSDLQSYYKHEKKGNNYEIDFISREQILYGYGKSSLTTRSKEVIKIPINKANENNFLEILRIILPDIKVNNETYMINDTIPELNANKLNYTLIRRERGGILANLPKGIYKYIIEYTYGQSKNNKIHYGYDISYGVKNAINYTNPPVYSPVDGEIIESKNGRVIIKTYVTKKISNSDSIVTVSYFHVLEHMASLENLQPQNINKIFVKKGQKIGLMGGTNLQGKTVYSQHVHYSMYMSNKHFTGSTTQPIIGSNSMGTPIDIILNPQKFWDNGLEIGTQDYAKAQGTSGTK